MELKLLCDCGQKYKFDVEPVQGSMPFSVNCPTCGMDGTASANVLLAQEPITGELEAQRLSSVSVAASNSAANSPQTGGLRLNQSSSTEPPMPPTASAANRAPTPAPRRTMGMPATALPKYMQTNQAIQNNSFSMGILGAVVGAISGMGLMLACSYFLGFKFPLFGTIVGAITGYGARLFYRGTDFTLGVASAIVAFVVVGPGMYFMFGLLGILMVSFSLIFAVIVAFRVASG